MSKLPWFKFFPADYLNDTRPLSLPSRAIWMDILCYMWRTIPRGQLSLSEETWCRILTVSSEQFRQALIEFKQFSICEQTNGHGLVTLTSRRMLRDEKSREQARLRQEKKRSHADSHAVVTLLSQGDIRNQKSEVREKKERGVVHTVDKSRQRIPGELEWQPIQDQLSKIIKPS